GFQLHLSTIFVGELVLNADLAVKMVGSLHGDLRLLRLAGKHGFDDFFDSSGERSGSLFSHSVRSCSACEYTLNIPALTFTVERRLAPSVLSAFSALSLMSLFNVSVHPLNPKSQIGCPRSRPLLRDLGFHEN